MSATQQFADALQRLEKERDLEEFLELFAEEVELHRTETGTVERGLEGARRYWQIYLDQFETIASTFGRVHEDGELGELEWTGEGRLASGTAVSYTGCSLLVLGAEGKVRRFATYYDTAAFTRDAGSLK